MAMIARLDLAVGPTPAPRPALANLRAVWLTNHRPGVFRLIKRREMRLTPRILRDMLLREGDLPCEASSGCTVRPRLRREINQLCYLPMQERGVERRLSSRWRLWQCRLRPPEHKSKRYRGPALSSVR